MTDPISDSLIVNAADFDEKPETDGASCQYKNETYSDGTTICISDRDHKCRNGKWVALGTRESCSG